MSGSIYTSQPASFSQKYDKTLSKEPPPCFFFFLLLIKPFHLDSKQTEVERRGDPKLIYPLMNRKPQVSGSSQQELWTRPVSGSLRLP